MRRRRQQLEVSTFPFLAVLLCAMGALILVLLSMDRKARQAALARADGAAQKQKADHDRLLRHRQGEYEEKKRALRLAWEKKRDALRLRVLAEEESLDRQLSGVQSRLAEAARKLRAEQGNVDRLRKQLSKEKARLLQQEQIVSAARREATAAAAKMTAADRTRADLAAKLLLLEQSLKDLAATRQRDGHTYSVIPYHGKRGESRRPVYIECTSGGIVFHPDREPLPAHGDLRAALRTRLERQQRRLEALGVTDRRPYIMLLVRPDGQGRYYELQAAAREMGVDFGYEFVDADWVLHFPEDDSAPPLKISSRPIVPDDSGATPGHNPGAPRKTRGIPLAGAQGSIGLPSGKSTAGSGPGSATSGGTRVLGSGPVISGWTGRPGSIGLNAPPGSPTAVPGMNSGRPGNGPGLASLGTPGTSSTPGSGLAGSGAGVSLSRPLPFGAKEPIDGRADTPASGPTPTTTGVPGFAKPNTTTESPGQTYPSTGQPSSARTGAPSSGSAMPTMHGPAPAGAPAPPNIPTPTLLPDLQTASSAVPARNATSSTPNANDSAPYGAGSTVAATAGPPPSNLKGLSRGKPNAGAGPREQQAMGLAAPPMPASPRRPRMLRAASLSGGESFVFIECQRDLVIVYPGQFRVSLDALNHSPAHNPLFKAVLKQLERRQALALAVNAAQTPRIQIRFLTHADAERTFHLAYPALEGLPVPRTRYKLQPEDDVSRIVTEY